jgi:hypothetical protein
MHVCHRQLVPFYKNKSVIHTSRIVSHAKILIHSHIFHRKNVALPASSASHGCIGRPQVTTASHIAPSSCATATMRTASIATSKGTAATILLILYTRNKHEHVYL